MLFKGVDYVKRSRCTVMERVEIFLKEVHHDTN
jgi:hypothetical protein